MRQKDIILRNWETDATISNLHFCDELKAYVTGFVRSGNTYTANGAAEMIKEIVANIKSDDLEILFRMDSGYFDEKIIETIESLGCKYLIKAKSYSTLTSQATNSSIVFVKGEEGRETTELYTKLVKWEKTEDLSYLAY